MIIDFNINFNTYKENILNKKSNFEYICPKCGAKHSFIRHSTYKRYISFVEDNTLQEGTITIVRLKCTSCSSTHAILPKDIIPYHLYLLFDVLNKGYRNKDNLLAINK